MRAGGAGGAGGVGVGGDGGSTEGEAGEEPVEEPGSGAWAALTDGAVDSTRVGGAVTAGDEAVRLAEEPGAAGEGVGSDAAERDEEEAPDES